MSGCHHAQDGHLIVSHDIGTGVCDAIMPKMVLLYPMISGCHHAQDGLLIVSHDFGTEDSDAIMPKMVLIVYDDVRMPSCPRWSFNCVP